MTRESIENSQLTSGPMFGRASPGSFQKMRFCMIACCFALLASPLLASAASELSYAQQIDAAYKTWAKSPPSVEIPRSGDPHLEAMQLRATLIMGQDVR